MSKIVCAAIRFTKKDNKDKSFVFPCARHGSGYRNFGYISSLLTDKKYNASEWIKEEGFIDEAENFYSREKAFELVKDSLSASLIYFKDQRKETELFSEDLY